MMLAKTPMSLLYMQSTVSMTGCPAIEVREAVKCLHPMHWQLQTIAVVGTKMPTFVVDCFLLLPL